MENSTEVVKKPPSSSVQSSSITLNEFNSTIVLTEDDHYNPYEHRVVAKPYSTLGALAHLIKSLLGTGLLAMPMAFKNAGLVFGSIGTVIIGFLCTYCIHILVSTSNKICKKTKNPVLTFSETAEKAFESGPVPLRKYSKIASLFVDYALTSTYIGLCTVYIVFISTALAKVCNEYLEDGGYHVRYYILIIVAIVLVIGQIRELKYLVPFSAVANVFLVITFGITFYYIFNVELTLDGKENIVSISQMPIFFSTVIFALEGIGSVLPIESSMSRPQDFLGCPGILNISMAFSTILYAVIGFFGYVRFGDAVKGSITLNLPPGDFISVLAQVLVAFAILFSVGLQFYVPADILWRKVQHRFSKERQSFGQRAVRSGIILGMGVVAIAVPNLDPIIGLVGALFLSILGFFLPPVIETVYLWPNMGKWNWILVKNVILALFSVVAIVTGSLVSIQAIIKEYLE